MKFLLIFGGLMLGMFLFDRWATYSLTFGQYSIFVFMIPFLLFISLGIYSSLDENK